VSRWVCLAALTATLACGPSARTPETPRSAPSPITYPILDLAGGWRWILRTEEAGTTRVEDERWRLRPEGTAHDKLVGRYVRTVDVASTDGRPFACNQRPRYRQRAIYDVTVTADPRAPGGYLVHETAYRTEPGPCDHGFRHLGDYHAEVAGERLTLHWKAGAQTLLRTDDDETAALPDAPWPDAPPPTPAGAWRWLASSYDDDGNIRDEVEWWEISRRTDTTIDATYRRRVTVRSPDGSPIACAGAPTWSFDDAYVLTGAREEEHWHLAEIAVDPADHPCLRATPHRHLDEATGEQLGDYFVLEWRGKRKQVLYQPDRPDHPGGRPDADAAAALSSNR
jgi:hypothetical protein